MGRKGAAPALVYQLVALSRHSPYLLPSTAQSLGSESSEEELQQAARTVVFQLMRASGLRCFTTQEKRVGSAWLRVLPPSSHVFSAISSVMSGRIEHGSWEARDIILGGLVDLGLALRCYPSRKVVQ